MNIVLHEASGFIVSVSPLVDQEMLTADYGAGVTAITTTANAHPDTHFVDAGVVRPLSVFPNVNVSFTPVNSNFRINIDAIPPGTVVTWPDDFISTEDDGSLKCVVNLKGEYEFLLQNARYFDKRIKVDVE